MTTRDEHCDSNYVALPLESSTTLADLKTEISAPETVSQILKRYPMRLTPHLKNLIQSAQDPIGRQFLPHPDENLEGLAWDIDGWEKEQSPVPGLVHRYPDRVLLKISDQCAAFCRYCFRKPFISAGPQGNIRERITSMIAYVEKHPSIREVILSGGDPFMLKDQLLENTLDRFWRIPHVTHCRIHTRIPGTFPQRITPGLVDRLKKFQPLFIMIQFNHPQELTPTVQAACQRLQSGGAILGSQSVLLKTVNDDHRILTQLMGNLIAWGIRPYYLHQLDRVAGVGHFHVPIKKGIEIVSELRKQVPGIAMPTHMVELSHGAGKIPLLPGSVIEQTDQIIRLMGPDGTPVELPL